jgi:hypothetical protein
MTDHILTPAEAVALLRKPELEAAERRRAYEERKAAEVAAARARHAELVDSCMSVVRAAATLQAVAELHAPDGYGNCRDCLGVDGGNMPWPCETVELLLRDGV